MTQEHLHELAQALEAAGLVGPHQSHSRANNISKINALYTSDPEATFGITGIERYTAGEVLGFLAEITGCSTDIADESGSDTIDPLLSATAIERAASRLRDEAQKGSVLLAVTGHPTGVLELYIRIVDAYRMAGGKVTRPCEGQELAVGRPGREVRYVGNVGCLADWGTLKHTHGPAAMEALLGSGEALPDLVLGDHGFAGAAIEQGIPVIAVMDINDPALAVAAHENRDVIVIPMDDNRLPHLYEPVWRAFEETLKA
jgi:hypothetical protein